MQKIDKTDTLETILTKDRFEVDYYQREYRWGRTQIEELPQKAELKESTSSTTRTMFYISTKEASGSGYLTSDDKFVLCKGSTIKAQPSKACAKAALKKREYLIEDGVIVDNTLMDDVLLSSSSLAASLITGFSTSGPEWWKTKDGVSLKELQMKE